MTQDHEASEGVMATPRIGGDNMGTQGHDAHHPCFLFKDKGMWFSRLVIK